jgi:threonine/homoserine/homoserine lactone efflux protein
MPDSQLLIAFFASAAVFAYAPGPSTLYAAAQTIAGGRNQGLQAAFGIHLGGYFHAAIVAMGVASLFTAVPIAYTAMKVVGSVYLCVLGISMWRSTATRQIDQRANPDATDSLERQANEPSVTSTAHTEDEKTLSQSALVEILNPKTAIFYLAFLPQFTDPAGAWPVSVQLLILGTIVNFLFSSADLVCVFFAERIVSIMKNGKASAGVASRIAGVLLILLGVNLFLT